MKKTYHVRVIEKGKEKWFDTHDNWEDAEGTLVFLQHDRKNDDGYVAIEETTDEGLKEIYRVAFNEHIPANEATEFHLYLRGLYVDLRNEIEELTEEDHVIGKYTELQDKLEEREQILRKFEEMVPHGLKKI